MEEFIQFFGLIKDNTLLLIIFGLFLGYLVSLGDSGIEKLRQIWGLKKHHELVQNRLDVSEDIEKIIERLELQTKACRVYVLEFHNGVTGLGGLPFLKMSCTYETLGIIGLSERESRQNMSLSLYNSFIRELIKEDYLLLDINNPTENFTKIVWGTLEERQISKTLRVKIIDNKKHIIGYLGLDYCVNPKVPENDEILSHVENLQKASVRIGSLLSINNKINQKI